MNPILAALDNAQSMSPFTTIEARLLANALTQLTHLHLYERSIAAAQETVFFLGRQGETKSLVCLTRNAAQVQPFEGNTSTIYSDGNELTLVLAPLNAANAAALRTFLPFLVARPFGLRQSAGCGDRLGLATPGHIRAFRSSFGADGQHGMAPILAQQSIRENARTGRTPQEVMDDAMWGVFQEGWRHGFGADADHLKATEDIDVCVAAGYTFYTIDPGAYVDDRANHAAVPELEQKVAVLPWDILASSPADLLHNLAERPIDLGDFSITLSHEEVLRSAAKYGRAVAHTVQMYHHLVSVAGAQPFELEMSVDETETITTLAEHIYIARELQRLNVKCVSLAPRYPGRFEKGADYIGDLAEFETAFARHLAVAKTFGPYKLSLHSGSDKFSIYPIAARVAGELVHLKTAGTSYLEALRATALLDPTLFREIVDFALERYPVDRATYHVSAEVDKAPDVQALADSDLSSFLDDFHGREILHVTFGSVLNHAPFRAPFFALLRSNEETYTRIVETHFNKHFAPFVAS